MIGLGLNIGKGGVSGFGGIGSVSSLLHWFSFNTGQTIDESVNPNQLTQWNDQKGSNNLTQTNAVKQPQITNGIIDFSASQDQLFFDSDVSLTNFTICFVVSTDFGVDTILGNLDSASVLLRFGQLSEKDKVRLQIDVTDGGHGIQSFDLEATSDFSQSTNMVFTLTRDVSSNTAKMFENTTEKFSGNLVTSGGINAGNSPFVFDKVGSHGSAQSNPYSDSLSEIVIFNQDLSQNMNELTNVINDIKTRNSIT